MMTSVPGWGDDDGAVPHTPCREDPAAWDADRTRIADLRRATVLCVTACPMLRECRTHVKHILARSPAGPRSAAARELGGMVWAGVAYNRFGLEIDLNDPAVRSGPRIEADTRIVDEHGRVFDGHSGRWVPGYR